MSSIRSHNESRCRLIVIGGSMKNGPLPKGTLLHTNWCEGLLDIRRG